MKFHGETKNRWKCYISFDATDEHEIYDSAPGCWYDLLEEPRQWLEETFHAEGHVWAWDNQHNYLFFKKESDAMWFMLKWKSKQ